MFALHSPSLHPIFSGKPTRVKPMRGSRQLCTWRLHSNIPSNYMHSTPSTLKTSRFKLPPRNRTIILFHSHSHFTLIFSAVHFSPTADTHTSMFHQLHPKALCTPGTAQKPVLRPPRSFHRTTTQQQYHRPPDLSPFTTLISYYHKTIQKYSICTNFRTGLHFLLMHFTIIILRNSDLVGSKLEVLQYRATTSTYKLIFYRNHPNIPFTHTVSMSRNQLPYAPRKRSQRFLP